MKMFFLGDNLTDASATTKHCSRARVLSKVHELLFGYRLASKFVSCFANFIDM